VVVLEEDSLLRTDNHTNIRITFYKIQRMILVLVSVYNTVVLI